MKVLPGFCMLSLLLWAGCSDNALISKPVSNEMLTTAAVQTNIAVNKTATASSVQSANTASKGNDNSTTTRWCASSATVSQWWKVDLGSVTWIGGTEIMWEKAAAGYKYKIETSTDNSTWILQADLTANTSSAQTQTQSFNDIARYVRITITGLPANAWASFCEFRVFSGTPPTPKNLKATAVSYTEVDLTYDNYTSSVDYLEIEGSYNGGAYTLLLNMFVPSSSTQAVDLLANTKYSFRIRAKFGNIYSAYSNIATATTLPAPAPVPAPSNLKVAASPKFPITLTWTDNSSNEVGFYITRSDNGGTFYSIGSVGPNVKTFQDIDVSSGNSYQYYVTAYSNDNSSDNSNTVTVSMGAIVNLLANPGFEVTGSWVKWNNANPHQTDYPHSGDYSATLGAGASSLQQTITGLTPNTTYALSGWGLVGAFTDVFDSVYIGVKNYGGTETKVQFPYTRRWAQQFLTFKTGASNTSAVVYFYKVNGAATSYFDDMLLNK